MGRIYSVPFGPTAVTTAVDIAEVLAQTDVPVRIHGWHLGQNTELGDAAEEILNIKTIRGVGTVTSGSGGAAGVETPVDDLDAAAVTIVEVLNTTQMLVGTGTLEPLEDFYWNVRVPWDFYYTPETRPRVNPDDRWVLELSDVPADSITLGGVLWFEEL